MLGGVDITAPEHGNELWFNHATENICASYDANQLTIGAGATTVCVYPQRQPPRYEHVERLKTHLALRTCMRKDYQQILAHIRKQVRTGARLHELLPSTEQMLRVRAVVLPGLTVLARMVGTARVAAAEELFRELGARIPDETTARILALLDMILANVRTPEEWLGDVEVTVAGCWRGAQDWDGTWYWSEGYRPALRLPISKA
jgi:hypothetical protein